MPLLSIGLLAHGCGPMPSEQAFDAIEVGAPFKQVVVRSSGDSRFVVDGQSETQKTGSFKIAKSDFSKLVARLDPYRSEAKPTAQAWDVFATSPCPAGAPRQTDAGTVFVRWTGPDYDQTLVADLGCDYRRHETRNREILALFKAMPLPESGRPLP